MKSIVDFKSSCKGLDMECEVLPLFDTSEDSDERQRRILSGTANIEEQLAEVQDKLAILNKDIDRLTNHADGLDYIIAVASGLVAGILDVTLVGEWDFAHAKEDAYRDVNSKVVTFAKKLPDYIPFCNFALEGKGGARRKPKDPDRLETAVEFLEWKFPLPGDGAYRSGNYGISGNTHRLDDFCHHPTLVGLVCCILVQFTGKTRYVNKYGEDILLPIEVNDYGEFQGKTPVTKLFSGIINWFIVCAKTIANRKGHLMSDVATSASLPGSFLSIITELASIPCFRNADFLEKFRNAYVNGIGTGKGQIDLGIFNQLFEGAQSKLDVTTEKAIAHELKRQAVPVVLNEILVRAAYFIRGLIKELKDKQEVALIDWKNILPFNNRTVIRMLTIATTTFTAVDMADAAIHAAPKSVDITTFFSNMVLRVNFVGVGRVAIAFTADAGMGISRTFKCNQRMKLQAERLQLLDAKVYYKQAGMWVAAEQAGEGLDEAYRAMEKATEAYSEAVHDIKKSFSGMDQSIADIKGKNPSLIDDLADALRWG